METLMGFLWLMRWLPWVLRTLWRHENGRWFVFRDAPLDFVAGVAAMHNDTQPDPGLARYFQQAHDELAERLRRVQRAIELHTRQIELHTRAALSAAPAHPLTTTTRSDT